MSDGHKALMAKTVKKDRYEGSDVAAKGLFSKDGVAKPRVVVLGGDHTIVSNAHLRPVLL